MATRASRPKGINSWNVAARVLAAIPANYALTSLAIACAARTVPMPPAEASVAATLLSFAFFAVIALFAFGMRSTARLWLWMVCAGFLLGGGLWVSILVEGRL